MNHNNILFLTLLRHALHPTTGVWQPEEDITSETWDSIFKLAREQNVIPMIYNTVYQYQPQDEQTAALFGWAKQQTIRLTMMQIQKTADFYRLYEHLKTQGVTPIVTKGILCRSLYPDPDGRLSNDEDLLIPREDAKKCHEAMLDFGMFLLKDADPEKDVEFAYGKQGSPLYIELHTSLFHSEAAAYKDWNQYFDLTQTEEIEVDGHMLRSLPVTDHFFYLIGHAFKHFMHSGCGIRQICDILMTAEHYKAEIDWEQIEAKCTAINGDQFVKAIFRIGEKYLGFDLTDEHYPDFLRKNTVDEEALLEDLLDAGVFGDSSRERLHSSTMTLNAVSADKEGKESKPNVLKSVFPSANELKGRYTYLETKPYLLPIAWFDRIRHYTKEMKGNRKAAAESISLGEKRIELFKKYRIIGRTEEKKAEQKQQDTVHIHRTVKKVDTREYVSALRDLVREGKTVSMTITGSSMSPFLIHERDQIIFEAPDRKLKKGDIVFYERTNGQFVCHRIYKVRKNGTFDIVGDNQTVIEHGTREEQIFARITKVIRKGRTLEPGMFWWEFFEKVWIILIPIRRLIITIYTRLTAGRHQRKEER